MREAPRDQAAGYEVTDAHPVGVAWFGAGLALFLALVALVPLVVMPLYGRRPKPTVRVTLPPQPRLQLDPIEDLASIRKAELQRLESFGWNDAAHTVAHIPITEAMKMVVARGFTVRAGAPAVPPRRDVPLDQMPNPPGGRP